MNNSGPPNTPNITANFHYNGTGTDTAQTNIWFQTCQCQCHGAFGTDNLLGCVLCIQYHSWTYPTYPTYPTYTYNYGTVDPVLLQLVNEIKVLIQEIKNKLNEKRRSKKSRKLNRSKSR